MIQTPNMSLDHPAWKVAHRCYLDAVARQSEHVRESLDREIGCTFEGFIQALADRLLNISSHFLDDGLNYVVSIGTAEGYAPLAKIHASRLGLDDEDSQLAELLNGA
ncbi:hypothetical protein [Tessaracoccus sp. Y1736]